MRAWRASVGIGVTLVFAGLATASTWAQYPARLTHPQPYAGQQNRAISSFSEEELTDLREGRGMGLARPAELNGYPGPAHVLELATELKLTDEQRRSVEAIFSRMKHAAQAAGAEYLEAERAVDAAFRSGRTSPEEIRALVRRADSARAEVRIAHLDAHLETATLLSAEQRHRYAKLRGYEAQPDGQHHHRHQR